MYHGEVVYRDGEVVGDVRAASYGHTLGAAVGLAMAEPAAGHGPAPGQSWPQWIASGAWEIDVAGTRFAANASLRPLYDPANERIRM